MDSQPRQVGYNEYGTAPADNWKLAQVMAEGYEEHGMTRTHS